MHEAFARGVRMTGGGAREQPKPTVSEEEEVEEVGIGAEQGLGAKPPVVITEEVRAVCPSLWDCVFAFS